MKQTAYSMAVCTIKQSSGSTYTPLLDIQYIHNTMAMNDNNTQSKCLGGVCVIEARQHVYSIDYEYQAGNKLHGYNCFNVIKYKNKIFH